MSQFKIFSHCDSDEQKADDPLVCCETFSVVKVSKRKRKWHTYLHVCIYYILWSTDLINLKPGSDHVCPLISRVEGNHLWHKFFIILQMLHVDMKFFLSLLNWLCQVVLVCHCKLCVFHQLALNSHSGLRNVYISVTLMSQNICSVTREAFLSAFSLTQQHVFHLDKKQPVFSVLMRTASRWAHSQLH